MHECPGPECEERVDSVLLACRRHWYQVPAPIRKAVYDTWAGGAGLGTDAYEAARNAAIARMTPLSKVRSNRERGQ